MKKENWKIDKEKNNIWNTKTSETHTSEKKMQLTIGCNEKVPKEILLF